jgi:hypothetical protein
VVGTSIEEQIWQGRLYEIGSIATGMIAAIENPLDLLSQPRKKPKKSRKDQPTAKPPRPCPIQRWRSRISSATTGRRGVAPMLKTLGPNGVLACVVACVHGVDVIIRLACIAIAQIQGVVVTGAIISL